jgi:hypothetical protein
MKKLSHIFVVLTFLFVFSNDVFAVRVITASYHKSCFIGCASVDWSNIPTTLILDGGTTETVIIRSVNCTGFGFNICPSRIPVVDNPNWLEAANDIMFDRSIDAINNGTTNGTYSQTFLNVDTGKKITFYVDWIVTFNDDGEVVDEKIEVYYLN